MDSVIAMAQAGLSEEVIIARVRKDNEAFDLAPEDLIRLKKANVSDGIIQVMMDPKANPQPAAAPASPPVVPGAGSVSRNTPANPAANVSPPATATALDSNDPLAPHDSGIYLYAKDRDDQPRMVVLERAAYQGSKTGGVFTSAMTYGIKKAKTKAVLPGAMASIRISDPAPVFYFYFEDKAAGLGKSYFGINSLSNPNQFALLKLEVAKSNRETVIGEFGAFGSSTGTHEKSMVSFKSERLRSGVYKVSPNEPLAPGEYCFLASSGMMGAYGAGASGAVDIFDFGVNANK